MSASYGHFSPLAANKNEPATRCGGCRNPVLSRGHLDLQSNTLPTELFRLMIFNNYECFLWKLFNTSWKQKWTSTRFGGCRNPGLNRGCLDLQSNAHPTELFRLVIFNNYKFFLWKLFTTSWIQKWTSHQVRWLPKPGIEPGTFRSSV